MKKVFWILIIILIVISGICLNRAYAYIYNTISKSHLLSPDDIYTYKIDSMKKNSNSIYVALGDSLTAGVGVENYKNSFPYILSKKMSSNGNVILKNRSVSGFKTEDLKKELLPLAIDDNPDIITLFIGVNDVHGRVSKENFKKNYEDIIKSLKDNTYAEIHIINLPFIGSNRLILPPYNMYFDSRTQDFNKIIKELAQNYNLNYIDIYSDTKKEFKKSNDYYSKDLFHPSDKGYSLWANIIYDNLNK